jgi:hypothetical protein
MIFKEINIDAMIICIVLGLLKMTVNEMSAAEMTVDEMTVDEMTFIKMTVDEMTAKNDCQ